MKAKQVIVMLLAMISFMCFGLSFNKIEAAVTEEVYKEVKFGSDYNSDKVGSYTSQFSSTNNGFTVNVVNGNNNNNQWSYIKFGSKSAASVGTVTTASAIDKAITKVDINIAAVTISSINSVKLYVSSDAIFDANDTVYAVKFAIGVQTVTIANPTANLYYKLEVDCKQSSSNGTLQLNDIKFYAQVVIDDTQNLVNAVEPMMSLSYTYTKKTVTSGEAISKYTKVTSVSELIDGTQVYLVGSNSEGTVTKIAAGKGVKDGKVSDYLAVEDANIDSNGYLTPSATSTPVTVNVSGTGYTLKLGDEYIGSTTVKSLTFSSTKTVWNISFDAEDDNKAIIKISDDKVLQYNASSPRFTTYSNTGSSISLYKLTVVQASTTTYTNSEFRIKCGIDMTGADELLDVEGICGYGIYVSCGDDTRYYDLLNTKNWYDDSVANLYYVIISLGDVISNETRATDVFTIGAYVQKDSDNSYVLSSKTKECSVADLVKTYYQDKDTKEVVTDLYNLFTDRGYYAA